MQKYLPFFVVLWIAYLPLFAGEYRRENSILLNGPWEYVVDYHDVENQTFKTVMERVDWKNITLPRPFSGKSKDFQSIKRVWTRRTFLATEDQAVLLAVLRWEHITFGATAYINGHEIGTNIPTGPHQILLPKGLLKTGKNTVVLKIPGLAGIIRGTKKNFPLFPTGSATQGWGIKRPGIWEDIWIDFADKGYMKWILAIPNLEKETVRFRVTITGFEPLDQLQISVMVKPMSEKNILSQEKIMVNYTPASEAFHENHFFVEVPLPGFTPWTPETPYLYSSSIQLIQNEKLLDHKEVSFGMREIKIVNGNFRMNGKNLWLRGSNLVAEWLSKFHKRRHGDFNVAGNEENFFIKEAREMSINVFRTHTLPPNSDWANLADEHGMLLLAEFPILYNSVNFGFTKEESNLFHKHCKSDTAAWMASLWNHPSIIMWVLSNESRKDEKWETGEFRNFVTTLDPTRPIMRSGNATADLMDFHGLGQWKMQDEGSFQLSLQNRLKKARNRVISDSEYMNAGRDLKKDLVSTLDYAQRGMEDTEAMRRLRFDMVLPYMFSKWTRRHHGGVVWKGGFAHPAAACWHSALSPILVSLDLFDASYHINQKVSTRLCLINDSWDDVDIHVDLLLTRKNPEFIPEATVFENPVDKWSFDFELKADTLTWESCHWQLPNQEGNYWLTARTTGIKGRPVLSQRFVRAIRPPLISEKIKNRTFVVLGADLKAAAFFKTHDLRMMSDVNDLDPTKSIVLVWNASKLTNVDKGYAETLGNFVQAGGKITILSTSIWDWKEFCDISVTKGKKTRRSRVYPIKEEEHPLLKGIHPDWLQRWNGLPGTVGVSTIKGEAVNQAEKVIVGKNKRITIAAEVPLASGQGTVLFSQLDLQSRVDRNTRNYDPVAERILFNLLSR